MLLTSADTGVGVFTLSDLPPSDLGRHRGGRSLYMTIRFSFKRWKHAVALLGYPCRSGEEVTNCLLRLIDDALALILPPIAP